MRSIDGKRVLNGSGNIDFTTAMFCKNESELIPLAASVMPVMIFCWCDFCARVEYDSVGRSLF